ncbi:MAG: hypothetical protein ABIQ86_01105 [Steroidobacteraceae bacterium]
MSGRPQAYEASNCRCLRPNPALITTDVGYRGISAGAQAADVLQVSGKRLGKSAFVLFYFMNNSG